MSSCGLIPKGAPCFVQLGRYGDLILLFPAFKAIHDRTGMKPVVMVSKDYINVMEGISYAESWLVPYSWWDGIPNARKLAKSRYPRVIVPQFWNDLSDHDNFANKAFDGAIVLQCHGKEWGINMRRWPNYMTSMWDRAGFTAEEMRTLPLVFDQRSRDREEQLVRTVCTSRKPPLFYNFVGLSSPFAPAAEVLAVLRRFRDHFQLVNIGQIRARRIYDLLGLYDVGAGLVTTDTATLHLAAAGNIPHIAFTVDGWCSSVPRGDCRLEIKYSQAIKRLDEMVPVIESWRNYDGSRMVNVSHKGSQLPASPPGSGGNVEYAAMG